jgi:hypothetical protein
MWSRDVPGENKGTSLKPKSSDVTQEMQLLLACCRASESEKDDGNIGTFSYSSIDWDAFLKLVVRHRVYPAVYRILNNFAENGLPEQALINLRGRFESNRQRGLELMAELVRLINLFEQKRIPVMPLKGPVLALQFYGDSSLRHAGDLDLLVRPEHVRQIHQLLIENGYRRTNSPPFLRTRQGKYSEEMLYHFNYLRDDGRISIEPHWSLVRNKHLFPVDADQLWTRQEITTIGGTVVKTLPLEETLLYLCMHGAAHVWLRLFWLSDVAQILRKNSTIDWTILLAHAIDLGIQRPLLQGLILSSLLLGSRLPEPVQAYAENDRLMPRLIKTGLSGILMRLPDSGARTLRVLVLEKLNEINLRQEIRYKLYCLATGLTSPNDWKILRLPDVLFPLYFVLRPFLWFWRWFVKGANKSLSS